jgi:hypothetical protein
VRRYLLSYECQENKESKTFENKETQTLENKELKTLENIEKGQQEIRKILKDFFQV